MKYNNYSFTREANTYHDQGLRVYMLSIYQNMSMALGISAALNGLSLGSIFLVYTTASIAKTFFITASTFGAMNIYGHTTKKDLTAAGSFAYMGLIGLVITCLINLFLRSAALDFAVSFIGVGVFTIMTAYDTQKLKSIYYAMNGNTARAGNIAIYGALTLYLDFINLFIMLLHFFGIKRSDD